MRYVANLAAANALKGNLVGNGQCVTLVHEVIAIPSASLWRKGNQVKGSMMLPRNCYRDVRF